MCVWGGGIEGMGKGHLFFYLCDEGALALGERRLERLVLLVLRLEAVHCPLESAARAAGQEGLNVSLHNLTRE